MARARHPLSPLLTLAAIVVFVAALHLAKEILLPLALAVLISFLLTPLANRLERLGLGRIFPVLLVVGVTFLVLGALGWVVTRQLVDLGVQLPSYRKNLIAKIHQIKPDSQALARLTETVKDLDRAIHEEAPKSPEEGAKSGERSDKTDADGGEPASAGDGAAGEPAGGELLLSADSLFGWARGGDREPVDVRVVGTAPSPLGQMLDWLGPLLSPLATAGIAVVLVIFILLNREDQRNRLLLLFGSSHLHATTEALTDVTERVSRYLRMQFLINAGYGLSVGLGLWMIGVPSAVMWGVMSFSLRFLPYIGPWMSAIMPLLVSIATAQGWTQPLMVVGWFTILELIVNNVAEPLLYGRSTGVSGVGVIVAAVFWTWAWGPIGLVLAMPLTVCAVVMARYIPALRFLTVLLGDEPPMTDPERVYQRLLAGDVLEARKLLLERLKTKPLVEVYDEILMPALGMAERDRHAGRLHEEQESAVAETARDLVEEIGEAADERRQDEVEESPPTAAGSELHKARVLCIPLRDDADEISAAMLKQLLTAAGMEVDVPMAEALTGEVVDRIESLKIEIAVICILPPLPPRSSRLLCRRLHERYPQLPIVVGHWCEAVVEGSRRSLCAEEGTVVSSLAAAVEQVQIIAARPRVAEKVG